MPVIIRKYHKSFH